MNVDKNNLIQNRDKWRVVLNAVMYLRDVYNAKENLD